ncbi:M20 metallopeptidase family protein [Patulibacter minatonensis]|uniref:M20 metallopeptidase family protein n=1 Tax=Patulibacter minatonensis TaxID=298163 RepID=UPI00047CC8F6|nr:M20 family metallopeptidase [Patulibacter minatonensis]
MATTADALQDDLVALRRRLHRIPEVGLHLPRTQAAILEALDGLPLEIHRGSGLTSVVAVLRGTAPDADDGPVVLLRADMDALPLSERTGLDFAADGDAMHACGHDLHSSVLVGATRLLCDRRDELAGTVVLMFQPGEEGHDGARHMLAEGLVDVAGRRPAAAYALHVESKRDRGTIATRPGPLFAASAVLTVDVHGGGGHAAMPHLARNPIPAAAALVAAFPGWVDRTFGAFDPVVATVTGLTAGGAENVIPDVATVRAAVRSFSPEAAATLAADLPAFCADVAAPHGCTAEVGWDVRYPVLDNDAGETAFALDVARGLAGPDRVEELAAPLAASEDFARVLQELPGCYLLLGARPPELAPEDAAHHHAPEVVFDDAVLSDGAALLAALAAERIARG